MTNSQQSSTTHLTEISLYRDQLPSKESVVTICKRLKVAFPSIQSDFMLLLVDMVIKKKMTTQRLIDAIDNLMENFRYQHPTIADVIGFDKKVKLYTHAEVVKSIQEGYTFENYQMIELNGEKRWTRKN